MASDKISDLIKKYPLNCFLGKFSAFISEDVCATVIDGWTTEALKASNEALPCIHAPSKLYLIMEGTCWLNKFVPHTEVINSFVSAEVIKALVVAPETLVVSFVNLVWRLLDPWNWL